MKKEYIIPIFVPHLGCPHQCSFCNQREISGQTKQVTAKDVKETIEFYLKNFKDDLKYVEVAFYGTLFTPTRDTKTRLLRRSLRLWKTVSFTISFPKSEFLPKW